MLNEILPSTVSGLSNSLSPVIDANFSTVFAAEERGDGGGDADYFS